MKLLKSPKENEKLCLLEFADQCLKQFGQDKSGISDPVQLYDGAVFSQLLEIMDEAYDPTRVRAKLANPADDGSPAPCALNLIHKALNEFVEREAPHVREALLSYIDFQSLNTYPDDEGMYDILAVFLLTAIELAPEKYAGILQHKVTSPRASMSLIQQLQEVVANGRPPTLETATAEENQEYDLDDDLAQEAEFGQMQRALEERTMMYTEIRGKYDRLVDNNRENLAELETLQLDNQTLRHRLDSVASDDKPRMQKQLRECESTIANLEEERDGLLEERKYLSTQKQRLEQSLSKTEGLADEIQELKTRNEELSRKANMADNYKKRLEQAKQSESELRKLENDRHDAMQYEKIIEDLTKKNEQFRAENENYGKLMEQYELEITENISTKSRWTTENNTLRLQVKQLEHQKVIDEQMVQDLQEKIAMFDPSAVPDSQAAGQPVKSLEDELREDDGEGTVEPSTGGLVARDLQVERLQAENTLLRSSIGSEGEKGKLLQELEDMRASRHDIQMKYSELLEKYAVSQRQMDVLISNMNQEGLVQAVDACYRADPNFKSLMSDVYRDEAYQNLHNQVIAEQNEARKIKKALEAAQQELKDKERDIVTARQDLSAVDKITGDRLEEVKNDLKNTDNIVAMSLREELNEERQRYKSVKNQFDDQQALLLKTFMEKDELRQEAGEAGRKLQAALDGKDPSSEFIKADHGKFEKLRSLAREQKTQLEKSEQKIRELERTLKAVRDGTEASQQKAEADRLIKNLQRENALMQSAWYDLNSRLQSNHVVLQRRNDVPKSWVNKQRQMVNATPRR